MVKSRLARNKFKCCVNLYKGLEINYGFKRDFKK